MGTAFLIVLLILIVIGIVRRPLTWLLGPLIDDFVCGLNGDCYDDYKPGLD